MYTISNVSQALEFIERMNCEVSCYRTSYKYEDHKWKVTVTLTVDEQRVEVVKRGAQVEDLITDAVSTIQRLVHGKMAAEFTGPVLTYDPKLDEAEHEKSKQTIIDGDIPF